MKKVLYTLLFLLPFSVSASSGVKLESADIDLSDSASLERGAQHYVTYCLGCHSAKHIRYKRIALDLKLDETEILKNVAPLGAGIYDQMHSAMNGHDAEKWFGTTPPDLSLIARSRGADWLYSYLKSFYSDPGKPTGVNNAIFKDVAMPNVFWQKQGIQEAFIKTVDAGSHHGLETGGSRTIIAGGVRQTGQRLGEFPGLCRRTRATGETANG